MPDLTGQVATGNTRDLLFGSGDLGAGLTINRNLSQGISESVPSSSSDQILRLLLDYQQYGQQNIYAGQQEQASRTMAQTPSELIGAPPSLQESVRNAQVGALEPTISGARDVLTRANDLFTKQVALQEKSKQDARNEFHDLITTFGGEWINNLDKSMKSDWERRLGYKTGTIDVLGKSIRERDLELKKQKAVEGGLITGAGVPGATTISPETGRAEGILRGVDAGTANIVKQLVDYKIPLPSGFALRSPYWQRLLGLAAQYDPNFDATQYNVRLKLKQDFTSGKSAQNIRSLNTVVGHLNTLKQKSIALQNSSFQLWNRIANFGITQVGDKRVVEFNNAANAVESELANVFKGTGATDQEIKAWRANLSEIQSPEQLQGAINTALELMSSRVEALKGQYETGLGKPKDFHFFNDRSRRVLQELGVNVDQIDPLQGQGGYDTYLKSIGQ